MSHGGNIYQFAKQLDCLPEQILDFSANINPEQALDPASVHQHLRLGPYADPAYSDLKKALTTRYPIPQTAAIEVFNGASAAIFALLKHLQPADLVLYAPLYSEYAKAGSRLGCRLHYIDRYNALSADVPQNSTIIFVNPATPDGILYDMAELMERWQQAHCTIIIDESFLDFCDAESSAKTIAHYDKLYLIKSLSKFYGCAGIRIGFIVAASDNIAAIQQREPAWKLSSFDMAYMQQSLANPAFIERTQQITRQRRELLYNALQANELFECIYPGQANFLLAKLANQADGYQLQQSLMSSRILIRICDNFTGLSTSHVRFAVKDEAAIARLAEGLLRVKI